MDFGSVEQAIGTVTTRTPGIVAVYLFGSAAREQAHRESDIDVAILLDWTVYPSSAARFDARVRLTGELGGALRRNDVDLVVLNDVPPVFAREIVARGTCVVVADPEAEHAFRRDVMRRAADLEPWLRRVRRVRLEQLTP